MIQEHQARSSAGQSGVVVPSGKLDAAGLRVTLDSLALVLAAATTALLSLPGVDRGAINDLGLVAALPPVYFVALGVLSASFFAALKRGRAPQWLMLLHLLALILCTYSVPAFLYETPAYAWTYKHVGVTEYIMRTGEVDPSIDIYFNWPGFFALNALFAGAAGLDSPLGYSRWSLVFFPLLHLAGVVMIVKALTDDFRTRWLTVWLTFTTNWVVQIYFAPQSFVYFLYLLMVGIALTWFRHTRGLGVALIFSRLLTLPPLTPLRELIERGEPDGAIAAGTTRGQRAALALLVLLLFGAIVASHQLTPFFALLCFSALVIAARCRLWALPLLMLAIIIVWLAVPAFTYTSANIAAIVDGSAFSNLQRVVGEPTSASLERQVVLVAIRVLGVALWGMALVGGVRRMRRGQPDLSVAIFAGLPFALLVAHSYGGEMLFRVFMMTTPFMAWFAAGAFFPAPAAQVPVRRWLGMFGYSLALLTCFIIALFGIERMSHFSQDELSTVQSLYERMPDGAVLLSATTNYPREFERYEAIEHRELLEDYRAYFRGKAFGAAEIEHIAAIMHTRERFYLIITRSQKEHAHLYNLAPDGALDELERQLDRSPLFTPIITSRDTKVYVLSASEPEGA